MLYVSKYVDLYWSGEYYIVRSKVETDYIDDGKSLTFYPILFFLYKEHDSDAFVPEGAEAAAQFYSKEEVT